VETKNQKWKENPKNARRMSVQIKKGRLVQAGTLFCDFTDRNTTGQVGRIVEVLEEIH